MYTGLSDTRQTGVAPDEPLRGLSVNHSFLFSVSHISGNNPQPTMVELREYFRESNAIEDVHEESAVDDTIEAWEYISGVDELTHGVVQQAHEHILRNRQPGIAGEYRDIRVYIDSHRPPPPVVVRSEMDKLLTWSPADPLEAIEWHIAFERIHPFADGNGRIGRVLYLWHCRQLDVTPILWRAEDRQGYYDLFQTTVDLNSRTGVTES